MELKETHRQINEKLKEEVKLLWGSGNSCCRRALRNFSSPSVETKEDCLARQKFEERHQGPR